MCKLHSRARCANSFGNYRNICKTYVTGASLFNRRFYVAAVLCITNLVKRSLLFFFTDNSSRLRIVVRRLSVSLINRELQYFSSTIRLPTESPRFIHKIDAGEWIGASSLSGTVAARAVKRDARYNDKSGERETKR